MTDEVADESVLEKMLFSYDAKLFTINSEKSQTMELSLRNYPNIEPATPYMAFLKVNGLGEFVLKQWVTESEARRDYLIVKEKVAEGKFHITTQPDKTYKVGFF